MSRLAACPKCSNQFSLPELAGPATIACPFCKALISLTMKPSAAPVVMVTPAVKAVARAVEEDEEDDDDQDEPVRRRGRKGQRRKKQEPASLGKKIGIVAAILLVTGLCIGGVLWSVMSDDKKPPVQHVAQGNRQQFQNSDASDEEETPEAKASEKFEIPDKALTQSDFYQSFTPTSHLPGLEVNTVKDGIETLPADLLNRVKQCTVYIETEAEQGGGTGSGFFACERGLVITNAHVIDMLEEGKGEPKSVRVYTNHGAKNQKDYKVVSFKVDRKHDLAILRLPNAYRDEYPVPMQLASSMTAHETQKVFSLGFPFGNSAGREVTVTPLSVTSRRFEEGRIRLVQFGGGSLNPGNSGGPIVDTTGRVIAVAVSIFTGRNGENQVTNTGISNGVPADEVSALFFGRADRLELFPPVRKGDALHLPVVFRLSEHSKSNASPKMKVVTGDEKTPPENSDVGEEPFSLKAGESKQQYVGSLVLPELQNGKVYWLQPQLTLGENKINWLDPLSYTPGKILDDKELPASTAGGAALGELKLKQKYQWSMNTSRGSLTVRLDYEGMTSGGTQPIKDPRIGARADDRPIAHQTLQRWWSNRIPDDQTFQSGSTMKLPQLLQPNLNRWHDLAQLDVPKEVVPVGKVWKVKERPVTLDYLFGCDSDQPCNLSCEYLGCYQEGSRLIGVVRVQGSIADPATNNTKYGKFSGLALIDGNSRQLLDMMIRCDVRKRTTGPNITNGAVSVDGDMQLRLQRPG
jgi:S1-C subfamily serine protease